ncbi:MAG TPA: hypothetical protein PLK31_24595, partial [Chloroflexota bacterium]|nr:hypothetical protein [Chloroflexota bacterium]
PLRHNPPIAISAKPAKASGAVSSYAIPQAFILDIEIGGYWMICNTPTITYRWRSITRQGGMARLLIEW